MFETTTLTLHLVLFVCVCVCVCVSTLQKQVHKIRQQQIRVSAKIFVVVIRLPGRISVCGHSECAVHALNAMAVST